jgi:hypothetical protein
MAPASATACASEFSQEAPPTAGSLNAGRPLAFYQPAEVRWRERPAPRPPFRRLLLALGPSQFVDHARRLTAALTRSTDVMIDLVCLVDGFAEVFHAHNPTLLADPDGWLAHIDDVVQAMAIRTRMQGVACQGQVLVGAPAIELDRYVQQSGADLLLLGGHIPGAAARLVALRWRPLRIGPRAI